MKILTIKRWFPFNFAIILQGVFFVILFCGGCNKKLQTFSRHFFWEWPSKYCIAEFTAIFVCLLLSWSRRYSMKWSSNFDDPQFQQYIPQFFKYDKPLPKYLIHWKFKMSAIFILKKEPPKNPQFFDVFKRWLYRNVRPYWYECRGILRDFCGLSRMCDFATFPEI